MQQKNQAEKVRFFSVFPPEQKEERFSIFDVNNNIFNLAVKISAKIIEGLCAYWLVVFRYHQSVKTKGKNLFNFSKKRDFTENFVFCPFST